MSIIKNTVFILLSLFIFLACNETKVEKKAAGEAGNANGSYGEIISEDGAVPASEVAGLLANTDSVRLTVKGKIAASCRHSGCWMDLDMGEGQALKITFQDDAFTIPLDAAGMHAIAEGYVKKEMIPVDLLKHYAEDEGLSEEEIDAITEPEVSYTMVARGVILK